MLATCERPNLQGQSPAGYSPPSFHLATVGVQPCPYVGFFLSFCLSFFLSFFPSSFVALCVTVVGVFGASGQTLHTDSDPMLDSCLFHLITHPPPGLVIWAPRSLSHQYLVIILSWIIVFVTTIFCAEGNKFKQ